MPLNTKKFKYISLKNIETLPQTTGVYAFKKGNDFLYIGKAINIKNRVKNHFSQPTFKDNVFTALTEKIGFIATGSELNALLLEAKLIKKHNPQYNTIWRDGKSHNFVVITNETFPRVFITHQPQPTNHKLLAIIGPFIDGGSLRQALRTLRKVFPFRTCNKMPKKACLYKELNLCLAPCEKKCTNSCRSAQIGTKNLIKVLQGQKNSVIKNLQKEMTQASKIQDFEKAKTARDQIFALENVFSHSHILKKEEKSGPLGSPNFKKKAEKELRKLLDIKEKIKRIEGYDISNIQGQEATGSMVVFENGKPNKNKYRKFKIKITGKPNDTAMLKEVISRRLKHKEWPMPQVMLIDGGIGQLNVALKLKTENEKLKKIKIISLAKKNNELFIEGKAQPVLLKNLPQETANLILQIRDEAHRFAITYHKKLRNKSFLN